jgi:hypothetical protein
MAKNSDKLVADLEAENTGGVLSGLLAEEDALDRRTLWRLGSWGVGTVGAVTLAVFASQSSMTLRREQTAAADLARQTQQIQLATQESRNETRRLASAVETLNGDRDRLYSRVTVLEQGLDSVTGAIARQRATPAPQAAATPAATEPQPAQQKATPVAPAPAVSPVTTTASKPADKPALEAIQPQQAAATLAISASAASKPPPAPTPAAPAASPAAPLVAAKSMMAPPDPAATKLVEPDQPPKVIAAAPMPEVVASAPVADDAEPEAAQATPDNVAVQRTEFGVDVGSANSIAGLRALWRGLLKSRSNAALTTLRPIIAIKEGTGGRGMQLRLVAGPLGDAAAAAKICAGLIESKQPCTTAVFDGQRLAMGEDVAADAKPAPSTPAAAKPSVHRRSLSRRGASEDQARKPDTASTLSAFFGKH